MILDWKEYESFYYIELATIAPEKRFMIVEKSIVKERGGLDNILIGDTKIISFDLFGNKKEIKTE